MTFRKAIAATLMSIAIAAPAAFGPALAEPPVQQRTQAPGFFRFGLGELEVTALYDGYVNLPASRFTGAKAAELDALLARMFVPEGVQTAVNAYLVHTGNQLVLADTGTAKAFGPSLGFLVDNLKAAGYDPAQVDVVLLTHLHPDHVNGLLAEDGRPAFANATVLAAKAEADYWLSDEVAAKAPQGMRPFFAMAKAAVAPYQASGRFKTFSPGDEVASGVQSVAAIGHTPGHTGYLFSSKGQSLLVWGDIVHSHAVQFQRPEVAFEYDTDQKQAVATRKRLLADAAANKLWVAGAHLPFPGIGHVRTEGKGYAWVPVEYGPVR